ncbi:hypothetical protein SAMN05216428_11516 [Nitrosospira sp. Nsp11]|uniref:TraK family protein n=1 Tax=Nitrosospira sp. Nsp11 TaxID=1855338 RepID=UPI00090FF271|nr:hypothetical protein SAMN05216428_11516 [Nitrosospira sp. Nsp11]
MPKNLSERIMARSRKKKATRRARSYAAFLSQREQIKHSLAEGWSVMHIWQTLYTERRITVCYVTFNRQVHRWIRNRSSTTEQAALLKSASTQVTKLAPTVTGGFNFDSTPKQEDLL